MRSAIIAKDTNIWASGYVFCLPQMGTKNERCFSVSQRDTKNIICFSVSQRDTKNQGFFRINDGQLLLN